MDQLLNGTEALFHIAMGVALASCAGLRAFVPLLVVGAGARLGYVPLGDSFEWLASTPALVVFGAAVVAELAGDKFPVVDHLLDAVQLGVKPLAGGFLMLSAVSEWSPLYLAVVWLLLGGGLAGLVHGTKAKLRLLSTATTGGVANPAISAAEDVTVVGMSVGSVFFPFVVAGCVLGAIAVTVGWISRRKRSPVAVSAGRRSPS